jgi:hypothetical protein
LPGLAPGNKKAHGCKLWIAIGLSLLRFLKRRALDPLTPRHFPPRPSPAFGGLGGAGAPGQGRGSCPAPKGLALDLGRPPPRLVGREGLGGRQI